MRVPGLLAGALVLLVGCGRTSQSGSASTPVPPALSCEGSLSPGELKLLADDSSAVAMGPCGELSFTAQGETYLLDSSLTLPEQLEGVAAPARFDPRGRGAFYVQRSETEQVANDGTGTLVYRELRGSGSWSATLPALSAADTLYEVSDKAVSPIDFYSRGTESGLFRCQGTTVYDYDETGQTTAHELGSLCPRALYSVPDALFVAPDDAGYQSVTLGNWQARQLSGPGYCDADLCKRELKRKVLTKSLFANEFLGGDASTLVGTGEVRYHAETGAEVGYGAMTTPEGRVVEATGFFLFEDAEGTVAVTDDTPQGATRATVRYFGPNPNDPARWLTSSFTLPLHHTGLHALPSSDLRRVAVWRDSCDAGRTETLLTFAPGQDPTPVEVDACVRAVNWVGSDGSILVTLQSYELALVDAEQHFTPLSMDVTGIPGVSQAVSDGRSLVIATGYSGTLHVIDLATGAMRQLSPSAGPLLVDAAHERLAFRAPPSSSSDPTPLWAGAFPH